MTSLNRCTRRAFVALALAFSLAILPGLVAPLVSDEVVEVIPGVTDVLADEPVDGGG